ncbi:MAG: pyruvate kinase [bacterium]|nr:pyruvate kinase [bacterium]
MKRTKIVCTIGPASEKLTTLKKLLKAGMNVARLNFSHGTYENHALLIANIRRASKETGIPVALLQDLQGPRIRIGNLPKEGVVIKRGEIVTLVPEHSKLPPFSRGSGRGLKILPQQYKALAHDVKKGTPILIADGAMKLVVESVSGDTIRTKVVVPGIVKAHKGLNVPGVSLGAKPITAKDKKDLAFGLQQGVDFVTLSFVKDAKDIIALQKLMQKIIVQHRVLHKKHSVLYNTLPKTVAKVERPEAVANIERIVAVADAVMIGRGDLALEADPAKLAIMQKDIVAACLKAGKPVIVATQMLESMMTNPRPTRAEISDVTNAVIDHADATMLSGETAGGQYPVEVVETMAGIIRETEGSKYDNLSPDFFGEPRTPVENLAHAVADSVRDLGITTVVVMSKALPAFSAIARLRPEARLIPVVHDNATAHPLLLQWAAYPCVVSSKMQMHEIVRKLRNEKILRSKDKILVVMQAPKEGMPLDHCLVFLSV